MPTAAKLVAGCVYAAMSVFVVWLYMNAYASSLYQINDVSLVCGAVCFITGWWVVGSKADREDLSPTKLGLLGSFSATFWCCLVLALIYIGSRLTGPTYKSTMDVFLNVPTKTLEFLIDIFRVDIMLAIIVGGIISGHIVKRAAAIWR